MSNPYEIPLVQSIAGLRLIPSATILSNKSALVIDSTYIASMFTYDSSSSASDNGINIIKPTDNSGNGRWILNGQQFPGGGTTTGGIDASGFIGSGGPMGREQYTPPGEVPIGLGLMSEPSNKSYFCTTNYGTANEAAWHSHVARGTYAAPLGVQPGDNLFSVGIRAFSPVDGQFSGSSIALQGYAAEASSGTYCGAYFQIETTPTGGGQIRQLNTRFNEDLSMSPNKIGIGTNTPTGYIEVVKSQNSSVYTKTTNSSTGAAAFTQNRIQNSASELLLEYYSTGYTTSGSQIAGASRISDNGSASMNIHTQNSIPINFWTNNTKKMVIAGGGAVQMTAYGAGTATFDASGNISSVSDPSLKIDQGSYTAGLNEILKVDPRWYKWNEKSGMETEGTYAGFMATDDFSVPGAVSKNSDSINSLSDRAIIAALVNAVKELKAELDELKK